MCLSVISIAEDAIQISFKEKQTVQCCVEESVYNLRGIVRRYFYRMYTQY